MPKALFCACNSWFSPSHVGSHHLAKGLARRKWDVAFISNPISPLHIMGGITSELKSRFRIYASGGECIDLDHIWTWVPGSLVSPHNKLFLRHNFVQQKWHRLSLPNVISKIRLAGFGKPDLVYVDSLSQAYWWQELDTHRSVFRMADNPAGFSRHTAASHETLLQLAQRVDVVACSATSLLPLARSLGARRVLSLPNGVDYVHFSTPAPKPVEYVEERRPIILYVGALENWFAFDWMRHAASRLPGHCFILIGPEQEARRFLGDLPNVRLLGPRPFADLPSYMQHANVGVIPFNVFEHGEIIHYVNPLKLYEYMAAGLPVVASRWQTLEKLGSPATLVDNAEDFAAALAEVQHPPVEACRHFAQGFDWDSRVQVLLEALGLSQCSAKHHSAEMQ